MTFFFFTLFANSALGLGVLKTSVNPILTTTLLIVAYLFALAMFKFELLENLKNIQMKLENKVNDVELTQ